MRKRDFAARLAFSTAVVTCVRLTVWTGGEVKPGVLLGLGGSIWGVVVVASLFRGGDGFGISMLMLLEDGGPRLGE